MGIVLASFTLQCLRMFEDDTIKMDDWIIFVTFIASFVVPLILYVFGMNKEKYLMVDNMELSAGSRGGELSYIRASMLILNFPLLPMLAGVVGNIHPECVDGKPSFQSSTITTMYKFELARWAVITYLAAMILGQTMYSSNISVTSFLYHLVVAAIACGLYSLTSSACLFV